MTGRLTDALASSHFAIAGQLTGHEAIVLRRSIDACMTAGVTPDSGPRGDLIGSDLPLRGMDRRREP